METNPGYWWRRMRELSDRIDRLADPTPLPGEDEDMTKAAPHP